MRHFLFWVMLLLFAGSVQARDGARERVFLQSFEGQWSGAGEIVSGKYKGTRFHCNFVGAAQTREVGLSLDGHCRAGLFGQAMKAQITRRPSGAFLGYFNDGARAQGMDITAARIGADHMQFDLNRQNLQGTMLARLETQDEMSIILSVKVMDEFVRVVGLNLKRDNKRLAKAGR